MFLTALFAAFAKADQSTGALAAAVSLGLFTIFAIMNDAADRIIKATKNEVPATHGQRTTPRPSP